MKETSIISVPWFWRVWIWCLIDVDIPQLTSDGIKFGVYCFDFTYSLQSSSIHSPLSSSFDATGLENYLNYGTMEPSSASTVVRNRTELNSIPLNVEDLWIGRFDTSDVSEFSPNRFQTLKTLVIGNCLFWSVNRLELNNLPSLQSIEMGEDSFYWTPLFSLTGLIDGLVWIHRSSSTPVSQTSWLCIQSCSYGCVWEWLNGWINDSDLPKLQSIRLDESAFEGDGDDDRKTISNPPYKYKNTMTMRSEIE